MPYPISLAPEAAPRHRSVRGLLGGLALGILALAPGAAGAAERVYYIAADEVVWDYAPSYPDNPITAAPFAKDEQVYLRQGKDRIGRKYLKAVYREYTDASFKEQKPRRPGEDSLGILGPTIHAEVGDTITVVFRNNTRFPSSIHPHGVFYEKASEGAHYSTDMAAGSHAHQGAMPQSGAPIAPGAQYIYRWQVPERAGPGPADGDSVIWLYHEHDHEATGVYAGLIGAIIVTRAGRANPDGTPKDVDHEFVTLFMIFDENLSPYLDANIRRFAGAPRSVRKTNEDFQESNKKHAINGLLYGNLGGLVMRRGERVRWYVIGLGNEDDLHTAHWHGNTGLLRGERTDTVDVFPATSAVVDMRPDDVGTWLFHCHVSDHMAGGMMTRYTVTE